MQLVVLSARPDVLRTSLAHWRVKAPWLDRVLVVTPEPVPTWRRLRALAAAARLTPPVWRDRRAVRTGAVPDADLPVLGRWVDPVVFGVGGV